MGLSPARGELVGRDAELEAIRLFLDGLAGEARALVLEGEAGIGKTTVWREAVATAERRSYRVLRAQPAESERTLSYSALADLIGGVYDEVRDELPAPQQRGLEAALLRLDVDAPADRRTTAAGLVSLLQFLAAAPEPVVVAVDDVQWLDRASEVALEFAARRLPDRVGLLVARRTGEPSELLLRLPEEGLTRLQIGPLSLAALHHVISGRLGAAPSRPLLVRVAAAAGGNPFYSLELARALERQGGERAPGDPLPVSERLHELVGARIDALSAGTRAILLTAAALSRPTVEILEAVHGDGVRRGLDEAEAAGVATLAEPRIRFTHPLLASAVYSASTTDERRRLHLRLAEAVADPEEQARHLALGQTVPSETVAAQVEAGAAQAARRGAQDAAADLYQAASRLTPPVLPDRLVPRLIGEGAARLAAGDVSGALVAAQACVEAAPPGPLLAEALYLQSQVAWFESPDSATSHLERALSEAGGDRRLEGRIRAKLAAFTLGRVAVEHADAAAALLDEERDPGLLAYVLVTRLFFGAQLGLGAPAGLLERALELERRAGPDDERSSLFLIWFVAFDDIDAVRARHELEATWYGERGEEGWRAEKQAHLALAELRAGNWTDASRLLEESCTLLEHLGPRGPWATPFHLRALLDAHQGRLERARTALLPLLEEWERTGNLWFEAITLETLAFVELSAGDPAAADRAFTRMNANLDAMRVTCPLALRSDADQVEVLVALDDLGRARRALETFEARAALLPRAWTAATLPRARAVMLAAEGDAVGALAELASAPLVEQLPFQLARLKLLQGQLQRRLKQKRNAAESLHRSLALFEQLGAPIWADAARAELDRVGLRRGASDDLTPSERRIAELAATGLTNREVAAAAFVSPKTVEANLARVYRKLGIGSRAELGAKMSEQRAQT